MCALRGRGYRIYSVPTALPLLAPLLPPINVMSTLQIALGTRRRHASGPASMPWAELAPAQLGAELAAQLSTAPAWHAAAAALNSKQACRQHQRQQRRGRRRGRVSLHGCRQADPASWPAPTLPCGGPSGGACPPWAPRVALPPLFLFRAGSAQLAGCRAALLRCHRLTRCRRGSSSTHSALHFFAEPSRT